MTFEDYIRAQIEKGARLSVKMGLEKHGPGVSIMTWTDKDHATSFWDVSGDTVKLIAEAAPGA